VVVSRQEVAHAPDGGAAQSMTSIPFEDVEMHKASDGNPQPYSGRVLIIGLDGATFDLIEPWAEAGHLPHLARLMVEGTWGRMQSTVPAHSAPAWVTFATGSLPGMGADQ